MQVLVANLGSTSFKYKFLDMSRNGAEIARGGYERIGQAGSPYKTHGDVIDVILKEIGRIPDAIGFKAVHGGPISGAVRVTDEVLAIQEQFADVAPAHNPPYIAAMRAFREKLPNVPQVAAFETAFHQTIPPARQVYAIPHEWTEKFGIRRYGFHGASHRYIATRVLELVGNEKSRRVISCHLGGSSSISAIEDGKSVANSFGMTAQSGLPHCNRVGDFDTFALLKLLKQGLTLDEIFRRLGKEGGMLGMSGVSPDMRDIEKAAAEGNARAQLAIDAFAEAIRRFIGEYLVILGGADVLVFTGGIGENGIGFREKLCKNLQWAGIDLDPQKNQVRGKETIISTDTSRTQIWIVPTNEELIVARLTAAAEGCSGMGFQPMSENKFPGAGVIPHHNIGHGQDVRGTEMASQEAIGLIETKGIVAAVEALDAALKAANVTFVEQHKVGSGLVAITLKGDVAAVRAAVDAGAEAGGRVGEIVSVHVIPRPHSDVSKMG